MYNTKTFNFFQTIYKTNYFKILGNRFKACGAQILKVDNAKFAEISALSFTNLSKSATVLLLWFD